MDVTAERRAEVEELTEVVVGLVRAMPAVAALGLCGSWAAGRPTMGSDLDLIVVTGCRPALVQDHGWFLAAVGDGARVVRQQEWGDLLTEVRVRRVSGLEVELGVADLAWAAVDPVDGGTARVVGDGFVVLHDPTGVLEALVAAVKG